MKARDHEKEVRDINTRHMRQVYALQQVGASRLCSYLSDETFDLVKRDLMKNADAGAGKLLELLAAINTARGDGKP